MQIDLNLGNAQRGWRQSPADGDAAACGQGAWPGRASQQLQLRPPACPRSPRTADGNRLLPLVGKPQRSPGRCTLAQPGDALGSTGGPQDPLPGAGSTMGCGSQCTRVMGPACAWSCSPTAAGTSRRFCSPLRAGEQNKAKPQGVEGCFLSLFRELLLWFKSLGLDSCL